MTAIQKKNLQLIWLLACVLLVACAPPSPASPTATTAVEVATAQLSSAEDTFAVSAWVDNPAPKRGDKVILLGNLKKNGVFLGGIMMKATWPDESQPRGMPNCYVMVNYQRGVCVIDAGKYPVGEFVPIEITFDYRGRRFTAQTGFTPQ